MADEMTPAQEAAAMWGSAENEVFAIDIRLKCALKALEFFGGEYERTEALAERVSATIREAYPDGVEVLAPDAPTGKMRGQQIRNSWVDEAARFSADGELDPVGLVATEGVIDYVEVGTEVRYFGPEPRFHARVGKVVASHFEGVFSYDLAITSRGGFSAVLDGVLRSQFIPIKEKP